MNSAKLGSTTLKTQGTENHDLVQAPGRMPDSSDHLSGSEAHKVIGRLAEEILQISDAKQVDFLYQGGEGLAFKLTMAEGPNKLCKVVPITHLVDLMTPSHDLKEALILQRVNHPGLAKFDQVSDTSDGFNKLLIREYIEGESLRERFNKSGRLSPDEAGGILREVLKILVALYDQGVTHQDIKPEHIILTPEGGVKLIDFGLAHIRSDKMVSTRSFAVGTVAYCNFEFNHHPSRDLYALGVALTEALFTNGTSDSARIGRNDLPGYMTRDFTIPPFPGLPDQLRLVLQKMRAEKERGFQTPREALDALDGKIELVDPASVNTDPGSWLSLSWLTKGAIAAREQRYASARMKLDESVLNEELVLSGDFRKSIGQLNKLAARAGISPHEHRKTVESLTERYHVTAKRVADNLIRDYYSDSCDGGSLPDYSTLESTLRVLEKLAREEIHIISEKDLLIARETCQIAKHHGTASLYLRRLSALVGESVSFESLGEFREELRSIAGISRTGAERHAIAERLSNVEKGIDQRLEGLRSAIDKFDLRPNERFDFIGYLRSVQEFRMLAALRDRSYELPAGALRSREFAEAPTVTADQGMLPLLEQVEPLARGATSPLGGGVSNDDGLFSNATLATLKRLLRLEQDGIASYMEQIVTKSSLSVCMVGISNKYAARPPSILTELKDWFFYNGSGTTQERTGYSFYLVSPEGTGNALKLAIELLAVRKYNGRLNTDKLFSGSLIGDRSEAVDEISITRRWFGLGSLPKCVVHVTRPGEDYHHFVPGVKLEFIGSGGSRDFHLSTKKRSVDNGFVSLFLKLKSLARGFNENVSWTENDWPVAALYSCMPKEVLLETHVKTASGNVVPVGGWKWPQPGERVPFQYGGFVVSQLAPMYYYNVVAEEHVQTGEIRFVPRDPDTDGLGNLWFEHEISPNNQLAIARGDLLVSRWVP